MSYRIVNELPASQLGTAVPTAYKPMIDAMADMTYKVTLILFRASKGDVIPSKVAEKALLRLPLSNGQTRIAIGGCFTAEAEAMLREHGFHVFGLSELHWTDESYMSIRQPRT